MKRHDKYASWQQLEGFKDNDEIVQLAEISAKENKEFFDKIESFKPTPPIEEVSNNPAPESPIEDLDTPVERKQFGKKRKTEE